MVVAMLGLIQADDQGLLAASWRSRRSFLRMNDVSTKADSLWPHDIVAVGRRTSTDNHVRLTAWLAAKTTFTSIGQPETWHRWRYLVLSNASDTSS